MNTPWATGAYPLPEVEQMNSIPKSTELRAMAQLLNIDYSTINFRSSKDRQVLYTHIQEAKAAVVPIEPSEELEALREENARLKAEVQKLRAEVVKQEVKLSCCQEKIEHYESKYPKYSFKTADKTENEPIAPETEELLQELESAKAHFKKLSESGVCPLPPGVTSLKGFKTKRKLRNLTQDND